jgi:hypothetical protein
MSSRISNVPTVRFRDPRVAIERKPVTVIDQGAEAIDHRRAPSSQYSSDSIVFNEISTGGTGMILDRKIFVEYRYSPTLSIQGIPGTKPDGSVNHHVYGQPTRSDIRMLPGTNTVDFYTDDAEVKAYIAPAPADPGDPAANPPVPAAPANPGQAYQPGVLAADRCRTSLNNILICVGLGSKNRSVGPRSLGLMQSCKTLDATFNTQSLTSNPCDYINALEWYDNHGLEDHSDYTKCASYPDLFKTYRDAKYSQTNPLADYGCQLTRETRGSLWYLPHNSVISVVDPVKIEEAAGSLLVGAGNNGAAGKYYCIDGFAFQCISFERTPAAGAVPEQRRVTIGKIRFINSREQQVLTEDQVLLDIRYIKMVEPVILPLLNAGEVSSRGLYGVNKFSVRFNLSSNKLAQKWWSGDVYNVPGGYDGDANHNIVTEIHLESGNNLAYMHYVVLRPHDLPEIEPINTYNNKRLTIQTQSVPQAVVGGKPTSYVPSGEIQYGTIPSRIYFFVKEQTDSTEIQDTDVFHRIDSLSFQFNSAGTQFSACTTEQLYQMCRESGLKMSLPQWRDHVGSVMCIDFTKNVNLGLTEYPGEIGSFRCSFQAAVSPLRIVERSDGSVPNLLMYIIIVEDGVATLHDQTMEVTIGTAQVNPHEIPIQYATYDSRIDNMLGGSFMSTAKRVGSSVASAAKTALPYVKKALPYIEKAIMLAAGAGVPDQKIKRVLEKYGHEEGARRLKKMAKGAGGMYGSGMVGGKSTSKSEMSKFLRKA